MCPLSLAWEPPAWLFDKNGNNLKRGICDVSHWLPRPRPPPCAPRPHPASPRPHPASPRPHPHALRPHVHVPHALRPHIHAPHALRAQVSRLQPLLGPWALLRRLETLANLVMNLEAGREGGGAGDLGPSTWRLRGTKSSSVSLGLPCSRAAPRVPTRHPDP